MDVSVVSKPLNLYVFKDKRMKMRSRILSLVLSGILLLTSLVLPIRAELSWWETSKAAMYSLVGFGAGLHVVAEVAKKSLGMNKKSETDIIGLAVLTCISCYAFVSAYKKYKEIKANM